MKTPSIAIIILSAVHVLAAADTVAPATHYTVAEIENAIISGAICPEFPGSAKKRKENGADLYVREITSERIPYQLFTFNLAMGYTVLIEADGKFVVLCSGDAEDFSMTKEKDRTILQFRYYSGSGVLREHTAAYVIGSGTSYAVAPPVVIRAPTPQEAFDFATSVVLVKRVVQDNQVYSYVKEVWRFDPDAGTPPEVGSKYGEPVLYVSQMQYPELDWIVFILGKNRPKGVIGSWQIPVTESGMVGPFRMNVEDLRTALKKTKPKT